MPELRPIASRGRQSGAGNDFLPVRAQDWPALCCINDPQNPNEHIKKKSNTNEGSHDTGG